MINKICLLLVTCVHVSNSGDQTPNKPISKADFEKILLKTADGIYGMLNTDKSHSLLLDEISTLLDSVTDNVVKRYGHKPPVESTVLRRVLENLTYLVADANALNQIHRSDEKSIRVAPIAVNNVLNPSSDDVKKQLIDNMMTNSGKPDVLRPIIKKIGNSGGELVKNAQDSQTLIVLNSKYMPVGETGASTLVKGASSGKSPSQTPTALKELQTKAQIFEDKVLTPQLPIFPWNSVETQTTQQPSTVEEAPAVINETEALKLTPRILFIDSNGKEYDLVGAGGMKEPVDCPPRQCMLLDDKSKEILAFQRPLSTEYLILRGGNGEQYYTSGVQICPDSDLPPTPNSSPTNLSKLLTHLRRRHNKNSENLRKLTSTWADSKITKRKKEEDEDVVKLFKWHNEDQGEVDGDKKRHSMTPRQAFRALRGERRQLRRLKRRFADKRRKSRREAGDDISIKGYDHLEVATNEEDGGKRVKRSKLSDIPFQGDIFDLLPEFKSDKVIEKGHSSYDGSDDSESIATQELLDLDSSIDEIERKINSTTTTAPPHARALDEEFNMVQPNTPFAIEEELLLKNATQKRSTTRNPKVNDGGQSDNVPADGSEPEGESLDGKELEYYDTVKEGREPGGDSEVREEYFVGSPLGIPAVVVDTDGLQENVRDLFVAQAWGKLSESPAEIVKQVDGNVLLRVRNSVAMSQVLGNALRQDLVLYNPSQHSNSQQHENHENVMRQILMKVLMDVEELAVEDVQEQDCLSLEKPLQDFLMELLGLPVEPAQAGPQNPFNVAQSKQTANRWT